MSLCDAINSSNYDDPNDIQFNPNEIQFNTIEDAVYLGMKNYVSFIVVDSLNLWEHQSTFNPNMQILNIGTV